MSYGAVTDSGKGLANLEENNYDGIVDDMSKLQAMEGTSLRGFFAMGAFFIAATVVTALMRYAPASISPISIDSTKLMTSHFKGEKDSYWTATSVDVKKHIGGAVQPWKIYKHTVSANVGTNYEILEFVENYVCEGDISDLGCNSNRLLAQTAQNDYTGGEIHWVDSDVFTDSEDKPTDNWNNMITDLGLDTYNVFMNNFVQLYVDDLNVVIERVMKFGVTSYFTRVSYTPDSSTPNVAHLVLYLDIGGSFIDMVGPLSAINDEYASMFSQPWAEDECAGAHALKFEFDAYSTLFADSSPVNTDWEESTGMKSPLFISTGISVTDLGKVDDVFTMVGVVTNMTETTAYFGSVCSYRELVLDAAYGKDVTISSTAIRYIEHDSAYQGPKDYTLADWELLHEEIYDKQLKISKKGIPTWSRYLDAHIGIESPHTEPCEDSLALLTKMYESIDNEYVISKRTNLHFYTGVPGILAWEFNAERCATLDDTCGCLENNSYDTYFQIYGTTCW